MPTTSTEQPEAKWHPARLIPSVGSKSDRDREERATSSLLAVIAVVKGFGRNIVSRLGAPAGTISTFTEVRFDEEDSKSLRPDGVIVVERGKTRWGCLVEVKTGESGLETDQIESYLDLARARGFAAVLTISNDIASGSSEVPVSFHKGKARGLTVAHVSWWRILTAAIEEREHRGIDDPEQAYILGELIRYLQDDKSGASGFEDMGQHWVHVRDRVRDETLNQGDPATRDVVSHWEEFIVYVSLELRQKFGRKVEPNWPRNSDRASRLIPASKRLAQDGVLTASIKIPDAAAPLDLVADLRTRQLTTSAEIAAPRFTGAKKRVSWMLRQTREMPGDLRVHVRYPNARGWTSMKNGEAQMHPERLLYASDPKREPRSFRLAQVGDLGRKRGKDHGSFVGDSRKQLHEFYREVLQGIRAWQPPAPQLPKEPEPVDAPEEVSVMAAPSPEPPTT